jgi:SHS2 domain-containing protein
VYRWVEHTAELQLEIEAQSEAAVFSDALAAFTELVDDGNGRPVTREIEIRAAEPAMLLVEWLSELIYLGEAEGFVPKRIASLALGEDALRASVEGHAGDPRHLVKAVTLHGLELQADDDGGWRARVVLDV